MTNRVQVFRSPTTGVAPAAGTRLAGELWTNFPDLQLGTIDASKNAQRLIAVRYFSTGANYAVGDYVVQGGQLYQAAVAITAGAFNIGQWVKSATVSDITTALAGSTGDNRIINGDMRIDQRNNGAIGTITGYAVDRWVVGSPQAGKLSWQRTAAGPATAAAGFGYNFGLNSLSAYTPAASESFQLYQPIEADMISDFAWGTPSAQPVTLSFWAQSSLTGTFSGSVKNTAGDRSYPFSFSLPTAGVLTRIVVTIPGDTAGTWVLSGNGIGATLRFDLGTVASLRGPADAWASANYVGVTGAVSLVSTNGATFYVAGVKLEIGSVATPFNRQSLAKSMADCQRYYQVGSFDQIISTFAAGGSNWWTFLFPVMMRLAPTVIYTGVGYTGTSALGVRVVTNAALVSVATVTAANSLGAVTAGFQASAEL